MEKQLIEILTRLVDLKDYKDKYGKDEHYLQEQPVLWGKARMLLKACEGKADCTSEKDLTGMRSYCQCFIPVNEKLPPLGIEVIFQNDKWIHPDFNPQGIRIGFRDDVAVYVSAYWSNCHDTYFTRTADEDDEMFELSKAEDQIPTKWMPIAPN